MDMTTREAVRITTGSATRLIIGTRETSISSRKSMAMLVYIALQPDQIESRERLAARLWSDSAPEHARAALRQSLRRLMLDLGDAGDLVEADRNDIRLTRPVTLDILEAQAEAGRGLAPGLLTERRADLSRLFSDFEDIDPEFNLWIAVQRERLVAQLISRLEAALAAAPDHGQRLALAEALAQVDPTHEGACRAAMQAHMSLGDTPQAMRCYERLWQVLEEDFDVEPSEKTQELYVAIKQGHPQTQPQPRPAASPARTCLRRSPSSSSRSRRASSLDPFGYFGPIFRDEMIGALSRFRDWLVIDGDQSGPTPPTYRAYSLRIALHGRDEGILVGMRLLDQADGHCIWAERADGDAGGHVGAAPDRAPAPGGGAERAPLDAAAAVGARHRQPDGAQVRALDAGAGAVRRMAGGDRLARRGDPA